KANRFKIGLSTGNEEHPLAWDLATRAHAEDRFSVDRPYTAKANHEQQSRNYMKDIDNKKEFLDALANGLRLIEAFDEQTRSVTIQSAAELLGMTRSAARRIVLTLTALGYMEQQDRYFSLAPKAIDLGYRYFRSLGVAGSVKPHLHQLSRELGVAAAIGVLAGPDVLFVERVEADRPIKLD